MCDDSLLELSHQKTAYFCVILKTLFFYAKICENNNDIDKLKIYCAFIESRDMAERSEMCTSTGKTCAKELNDSLSRHSTTNTEPHGELDK